MAGSPLLRPVWHALTTSQAAFALGAGKARRYLPEIGPLAGMADDSDASLADLAALLGTSDDEVWSVQSTAHDTPEGCEAIWQRDLVLMTFVGDGAPDAAAHAAIPLTAAHAEEMYALAMLTKPGPFGLRTAELGRYWGIIEDGRLVAMAGERMQFPGFCEISGVATHPDFRGRGFAQMLMALKLREVLAREEIPFLHSYADNAGAIALYERIGFSIAHGMTVTAYRRA